MSVQLEALRGAHIAEVMSSASGSSKPGPPWEFEGSAKAPSCAEPIVYLPELHDVQFHVLQEVAKVANVSFETLCSPKAREGIGEQAVILVSTHIPGAVDKVVGLVVLFDGVQGLLPGQLQQADSSCRVDAVHVSYSNPRGIWHMDAPVVHKGNSFLVPCCKLTCLGQGAVCVRDFLLLLTGKSGEDIAELLSPVPHSLQS